MKFRRQRKGNDEINVTPLIDVVFLLLIFFMVSTTFSKESHLAIDLPEASGEIVEGEVDSIEIVINQEGNYSLNDTPLINRQIETLMAGLIELSAGDTNMPLVITADATASHQAVVTAMDAAGRAGFARLSITTQQPETEDAQAGEQ